MLSFYLAALESDDDRKKFAAIYAQNHTKMENCALSILKEQSSAEDAVQNAFLQVIRHFSKVDEIACEELPFWLISIVRNEALILLRKRKQTVPLEDWDGFSRDAENVSEYQELVELFQQLPDTYRLVLEMKLIIGYTDKEIAERLGITETAVSTRASRGRMLLRKILEGEGYHL